MILSLHLVSHYDAITPVPHGTFLIGRFRWDGTPQGNFLGNLVSDEGAPRVRVAFSFLLELITNSLRCTRARLLKSQVNSLKETLLSYTQRSIPIVQDSNASSDRRYDIYPSLNSSLLVRRSDWVKVRRGLSTSE